MVGRNEGREAGRVDWDCVLGREAADGDCVPALRGVFERLVRLDILALVEDLFATPELYIREAP